MAITKKRRLKKFAKKYVTKRRKLSSALKRTKKQRITPQILKYISKGAYGQEIKTVDGGFSRFQLVGIEQFDPFYTQDEWIPNTGSTSGVLPPRDGSLAATNTFFTYLPISDEIDTVQALNLIQQGTGVPNRIGNKISLKSLRLRLQLCYLNNPTEDFVKARTLIVYDRQPEEEFYPDSTSILTYINQENTEVEGDMWASLSVNQMDRYIILMDKLCILPPYQITPKIIVTAIKYQDIQIDEFLKLNDLLTIFQKSLIPGDSAEILPEISTGALYIVVMGNTPGATPTYGWQGSFRLRFHDN